MASARHSSQGGRTGRPRYGNNVEPPTGSEAEREAAWDALKGAMAAGWRSDPAAGDRPYYASRDDLYDDRD